MLRFLRDLIFLSVLLIALPVGILILLFWWQRRRDEYTFTMMRRDSERATKPTAIEIPPELLVSDAPDMNSSTVQEPVTTPVSGGGIVEGVKIRMAPVPVPSPQVDDLRRVEGIGPKVAGLLQKAGITTFAQLAQTDVARLKEILEAENLPFINPETWPDQAALAAGGDWDGLSKLQTGLKGGRRD
ncbi:MAG: DUF4332 domain-containing protein [Anaerolineae bacterium]|nr:DUF4332 domain-containing protein [Anaerolineae bacterium]